MRSLAAACVLIAALLVVIAQPARAQRGPVCREPSVVDEITRVIKTQNYYGHVDPRLITEQPTTDPNIVRCQVCVMSAPYDTLRFGDRPVGQCLFRTFEVQVVTRGFVVAGPR